MKNKKWVVVVLALVLFVASLITSRGLSPVTEHTSNLSGFEDLLDSRQGQEKILENGSGTQRIMKLSVEGVIGPSSGDYNHELLLEAVEKISEDPTIAGVLLTIDSPGGAVYQTREFYDKMKEVKESLDLPIYVSQGSMAASGGYYLSMLGDKVYGTPETVTGSIGVILTSYNLEGLQEKLGIEPATYKTGDLKDMLSGNRESTAEEDRVVQSWLDESFDRFVDVIVEGRGLSEARVRVYGDGRIYTAQQAVELNLIDGIAYEDEVLQKMKDDLGLETPQVFEYASLDSVFPPLPFINQMLAQENEVQSFERLMRNLQSNVPMYLYEGGVR